MNRQFLRTKDCRQNSKNGKLELIDISKFTYEKIPLLLITEAKGTRFELHNILS